MKSNKQKTIDRLVKRCVRFLKNNPNTTIYPSNFHKAVDAHQDGTCILGVILFKNKKTYPAQLSIEARQDAAKKLNLPLNAVVNIENGFANWDYWDNSNYRDYKFDNKFSEIGDKVYKRIKKLYDDRVDCLYPR